MNLQKEITFSDLVPSRLRGGRRSRAPRPIDRRRVVPKELVGLKIDSSELSAAHVVNDGGKRLLKIARAPLASGIVSGGEVRDPAALGGALSALFNRHELPRRGIQLGLGNSRIGVRVVEVPEIEDPLQLQNMIRFRAHEMISASLEEAMIDYHVVGAGADENGAPTKRILLVVAYRDSIDRYLAATDAAELDVVGIDLEAFALLRAAAEPQRSDGSQGALAAVSIDHERTTLAISDGEICHFTRVVEWGVANIDNAVARGLSVTPTEAAALWRGTPVPRDDETSEEPDDHAAAARELVNHELQTLVRELQSSLRFYLAQPGALPVEVVHASGSLTDVPGIADELRQRLGVELRVIDPFGRCRVDESVGRLDHVGGLAVAVGLGIED